MKYFNLLFLFISTGITGFLWFNDADEAKPAFAREPDVTLALISGEYNVFDAAEENFLCKFENHLLSLKNDYPVPGAAIAVVKEGRVIYKKGFGVKDINGNDPVNTSTVFRIGSVSKGFAAGLAGILKSNGFIGWKTPITKYLPCYRANPISYSDSLTTERILSHTTGYPYHAYSTLIEEGNSLDDMIQALQLLKMSRMPGEMHAYQNVAYSLIEKVVESCTDTTFQNLMQQRIFDPLNMQHASTDYASIMKEDNLAMPHYPIRSGFRRVDISNTYYNTCAAGGVNASIDDMGKWLRAAMGYRPDIFSPEVLAELYQPKISTRVKNSFFNKLETPGKGYYGMGWRIVEYPTDTIIYHEGYVNGYKSAIGFSKKEGIGICILTNTASRFSSKLLADFFKMHASLRDDIIHPELPL